MQVNGRIEYEHQNKQKNIYSCTFISPNGRQLNPLDMKLYYKNENKIVISNVLFQLQQLR